ncbi:glycosyltransferase family 2 protein [Tahibacter amnicola]|uniref:Glycosyltransferase family 2 protein n=1 Tax=Tahibacter amnicola TaxID=2976241 RepID=A0ABY6BCP0_9GAMM|nr:glycosyltransferase family 2 protein [Tahibacter amnicola]UXI66386.1 glycosyltransferase family 2 protein [Tahibacter amnicola]
MMPTDNHSAKVPVAVVMLSLNEAHNMDAVCCNVAGWAQEVFLVDSRSADDTVDIALRHGVHVVQRPFRGFGDQWNFALEQLPITAPWTMKLDPDERLDDALKIAIAKAIGSGTCDGLEVTRRLWFMGRPLPVRQRLLRLWRTGTCRFSDVTVNEHPIVSGRISPVTGELEHYDSPDLAHWLDKQNRYSSAEAIAMASASPLAEQARWRGTPLQRRMWLKKYFYRVPCRYWLLFLYHYLALGAWRAGRVGLAWSRLRCEVYRMTEYKVREIFLRGRLPVQCAHGVGDADPRVAQY